MEKRSKMSESFDLATEFVRLNSKAFDTEVLLKLYGRYKQAKEGPCNIPKPRFYDLQGKQKWEAWHCLGKMREEQAQQEYIKLLNHASPDWRSKVQGLSSERSTSPSAGSGLGTAGLSLGIAVSSMANPDAAIDDELKTIFDWCKEGDNKKVAALLKQNDYNVDEEDEEGMVLLHWACDRGDEEMVHTLLKHGATVDKQDTEGQTALHYAVSCEHMGVVKTLLEKGAKTSIADSDGQKVTDLLTDSSRELQELVKNYAVR